MENLWSRYDKGKRHVANHFEINIIGVDCHYTVMQSPALLEVSHVRDQQT
jgi:hypothetical protein